MEKKDPKTVVWLKPNKKEQRSYYFNEEVEEIHNAIQNQKAVNVILFNKEDGTEMRTVKCYINPSSVELVTEY